MKRIPVQPELEKQEVVDIENNAIAIMGDKDRLLAS